MLQTSSEKLTGSLHKKSEKACLCLQKFIMAKTSYRVERINLAIFFRNTQLQSMGRVLRFRDRDFRAFRRDRGICSEKQRNDGCPITYFSPEDGFL